MNDRKIVELNSDWWYVKLPCKCPKCGWDISNDPDSLVNQVKANETEDCASDVKTALESGTKNPLAPNFFKLCVAWVAVLVWVIWRLM